MSLLEMLTIAIALGTDAFSVAIVIGIQRFTINEIIKFSTVIALFHIVMPLTGLYGGHYFEDFLMNFLGLNHQIHYILNLVGSGLLMLIGFYMIIERWLETEEALSSFSLKGIGLLTLSLSVSIDALSVGISLGMLDRIYPYLVIFTGPIAGIMMGSGLYFGSKVGHWLGKEAQIFGGTALILLGLHFMGLL